MKNNTLPLACLISGLAIGLFIPRNNKDESSQKDEAQAPRSGPRASSRTSSTNKVFTQPFKQEDLSELRANNYNKKKFAKLLASMSSEGIRAKMDSIAASAGFSGLDYKDESLMDKLAFELYLRDPNAAISWIKNRKSQKDQRELFDHIINELCDTDVETAISLTKQHLIDPERGLFMPHRLLQSVLNHDVDVFEDLITAYPSSQGSSGSGMEFPEGFDFATTMENLALKHAEYQKDGKALTNVPSNMLEEWAKVDPQAAYEWAVSGKRLPFNSNLDDFIDGYASNASPQDLGTFLANEWKKNTQKTPNYKLLVSALTENRDHKVLDTFLQNIATTVSERQAHLEKAFMFMDGYSGNSYDTIRNDFLKKMNFQTRSNLIATEEFQKFSQRSSERKSQIRRTLLLLGHSEQEVNTALSPEEK